MKTHVLNNASLARTRLILFVVVPALLPLGAIALFAWLPAPLLKYFFFTKGWMAWTLTEYAMHRWGFHGRKYKGDKERDMFNHTHHHTHPADMIITPFMRSMAVLVFIVSAWSIMQGPVLLTYFTGWLSGLSLYTLMHYFLHQPMASSIFPNLVKQHIWHHTKYANKCFGVCTTFWDRVFKTQPTEFGLLPERTVRFYYEHAALPDLMLSKVMRRLHAVKSSMIKAPQIVHDEAA